MKVVRITNMPFEDYDFALTNIINIVNIKTDATWSFENLTTSDHWILSLVINGQCQYSWKDQAYQLKKGDLIFFQQGFSRSARSAPDNPWQFIVIKFQLTCNNDSTEKALGKIPNIMRFNSTHFQKHFTQMEQLWRGRHPGYILRCKSILYDTIHSMMLQSGMFFDRNLAHQDRLVKALNLIGANANDNLSVEELAYEAELSPSYFRMLFKSFTGYSPLQYQNYVRIKRAQDLLNTGSFSVAEVAGMVGIQDVYYFSRLFKKVIGVSPSHMYK